MEEKYTNSFDSLCDKVVEYFKDLGYTKDHVHRPNPSIRNYFTVSDFIKLEECCTETMIYENIGGFEFIYDVNEDPNIIKLMRYVSNHYNIHNINEEHIDINLDERNEFYVKV